MTRILRTNVRTVAGAIAVLWSFAGCAWAADLQVAVAEHPEYGTHLVDGEGHSLYLFTSDEEEEGVSTCTGTCAENWPPLVVADGAPVAGEGVDAELLDEIEREDGRRHVTYAGWPLYTFVEDEEPGQSSGQGRNDKWFLVSPAGEAIGRDAETGEAATDGADGDVDVDALMAHGEEVFANVCAACHGGGGGGGEGPRLIGHSRIDETRHLLNVVLNGQGYMPAVGSDLTNEEIAAVLTYVRNSWGNAAGPVTLEEVEAER